MFLPLQAADFVASCMRSTVVGARPGEAFEDMRPVKMIGGPFRIPTFIHDVDRHELMQLAAHQPPGRFEDNAGRRRRIKRFLQRKAFTSPRGSG